jgi:hypothetical protein
MPKHQDVRQRLVFLAQSTMAREISGFQPSAQVFVNLFEIFLYSSVPNKSQDLDYPAQLSQTPTAQGFSKKMLLCSWLSAYMVFLDLSVERGWFPTLVRGLVLLSKLYRCVEVRKFSCKTRSFTTHILSQRGVFQGLSQGIVHDCVTSFQSAAATITARSGSAHAQLFLIKQLLVLREQTAPFDVDFLATEIHVDFSHLKRLMALLTGYKIAFSNHHSRGGLRAYLQAPFNFDNGRKQCTSAVFAAWRAANFRNLH